MREESRRDAVYRGVGEDEMGEIVMEGGLNVGAERRGVFVIRGRERMNVGGRMGEREGGGWERSKDMERSLRSVGWEKEASKMMV